MLCHLLYPQRKGFVCVSVFFKLRYQFLKVFGHYSFHGTGLFISVGLVHPRTSSKVGSRHFVYLQMSGCLYKRVLKCLVSSVLFLSSRARVREATAAGGQGDCCGCLITDALEPSWKLTEVGAKNLFNLVSFLFSPCACQDGSCHLVLWLCHETTFHWYLGNFHWYHSYILKYIY